MSKPQTSFTWSTRRDGNVGYVLEEGPARHKVEFGPMPAHLVPNFVAARRIFIAAAMKDLGAKKKPGITFQ